MISSALKSWYMIIKILDITLNTYRIEYQLIQVMVKICTVTYMCIFR